MSQSPLEQSIFKTLAYFDIADFPLTKEELYAFLWMPPAIGYAEFLEKINNISTSSYFLSKYGYYFLAGREEIVERRRERLIVSEKKLALAVNATKKTLFSWRRHGGRLRGRRHILLKKRAHLVLIDLAPDFGALAVRRAGHHPHPLFYRRTQRVKFFRV